MQHFFETAGDGKYVCKFAECSKQPLSSEDSTGNLIKHLKRLHKAAYVAIQRAKEEGRVLDSAAAEQRIHDKVRGQVSIAEAFNKCRAKKTEAALKILTVIIAECLPFNIVDSDCLHAALDSLGMCTLPSSRHLLRYLSLLRMSVDSIVNRRMAALSFVSVSTDVWTAPTGASFISIYIQGYTTEMALVHCADLIHFPAPHTAEHIKKLIKDRVDYRTSNKAMLISVTADGATAEQKAGAELVGPSDTLWCLAHLLQLVVRDVINDSNQPYAKDIKLVRTWIETIRDHNALCEALGRYLKERGQKPVKVSLDVVTRWDSVLTMVRSFLRVWSNGIEPMIKNKLLDKYISPELDIQQETLIRLEAMCRVLDNFSTITKLSGLKDFPTLVRVPRWIAELSNNLQPNYYDSVVMQEFKSLLLQALKLRTDSIVNTPSLHLTAAMLDPSDHELSYLPPATRRDLWADVNEKLATEVVNMNPPNKLANGEEVAGATIEAARIEITRYHDHCKKNATIIQSEVGSQHGENALKRIADWWLQHRNLFPLLAQTARGLLAIPATSVNNERAFSSAGVELSKKRQSMLPGTLEAICLIRDNVELGVSLDEIVKHAREISKQTGTGEDALEETLESLDGEDEDDPASFFQIW